MIWRARRLPAAELDKPFEVPVDEDRQTLRSLLPAGRPDGDVELRDRQQPYGWPAEEHRGLGRDAGKAGPAGPAFPGGVDAGGAGDLIWGHHQAG
jgi:hypothetical protein